MRVGPSETFETGLEKLYPAWKVQGAWPQAGSAECLVGRNLAAALSVKPGTQLTFANPGKPAEPLNLEVPGIVETGGEQDNEVVAPLSQVQKFTGLEGKIRRVQVSALTKPEDAFGHADVTKMSGEAYDRWYCTPYVSSIAYQIQQAIPGSEARPVYRVAATEGKIINSVGLLMALLAIAALVTPSPSAWVPLWWPCCPPFSPWG